MSRYAAVIFELRTYARVSEISLRKLLVANNLASDTRELRDLKYGKYMARPVTILNRRRFSERRAATDFRNKTGTYTALGIRVTTRLTRRYHIFSRPRYPFRGSRPSGADTITNVLPVFGLVH